MPAKESGTSEYLEELARGMKNRRHEAYLEFSEYFAPRFRREFMRRGLSLTEAEDLACSCVSDIALKVDRYVLMYPGSFGAWVFTLAKRAFFDWMRRKSAKSRLPQEAVSNQMPGDDPEEEMAVIAAVREAVAKLPEPQREVLLCRELGANEGYQEIGKQLGITSGTVRVRHLRALRRLGVLLAADPRVKPLLSRHKNNEPLKR